MTIITLICLVQGQSKERAFPVRINKDLLIGELKDEIKKKKPNDFHDIDANKLNLWKVNIPIDSIATIQQFSFGEDKAKGIEKMDPMGDICNYFGKPTKKHVHIIIE